MIILLPPSESKRNRLRGRAVDPSRWSFPELNRPRAELAAALATVSASPDAASLLGVSAGLLDEVARNLMLERAPATPALEVYTGVLYDALGFASLDPASRRRARERLVIFSALRGVVRPSDRITAYRLSAGCDLPRIGRPERFWRAHLDPALSDLAGRGVIVDCRSGAYLPMWRPGPELAERWVHVRVPGASHMAKHTRGALARALCQVARAPRSVPAVANALQDRFALTLTPPERDGRPWILDVTAD